MFQEYALPQAHSGLMRPVIDHKGQIWFGEMGHNALAVFDPQTQTFQHMTPPHGADGIMGIAVAADDSIWFAEQYANYIGHYFPATHQYRMYMLTRITTPDPSGPHKTLTLPRAPNDIVLDTHGNVWFTELNADTLGMLDIKTGLFKHYPLTPQKSIQTLDPYGIAIDPSGRIWFTESATTRIGRLDPGTGEIHLFTAPNPISAMMEIASDTHGIIWITSFNAGLLIRFDPQRAVFTPYSTSSTGNAAGGLYGLVVTPQDEVWVTVSSENALARLDTQSGHFTSYQIPTAGSLPLGIAVDARNGLWFTEASSDKIGVLQLM